MIVWHGSSQLILDVSTIRNLSAGARLAPIAVHFLRHVPTLSVPSAVVVYLATILALASACADEPAHAIQSSSEIPAASGLPDPKASRAMCSMSVAMIPFASFGLVLSLGRTTGCRFERFMCRRCFLLRKRPGKAPSSAPVVMPRCALIKRDRCTRAHYRTGGRYRPSASPNP